MTSLKDPTEFPLIWDNTMLAMSGGCPQAANLKFFHHIQPQGNNVNLHAGGAFAKAIETARTIVFKNKQTVAQARISGARELIKTYGDYDSGDSSKSIDRVLEAFDSYLTQYDPASDHIKPVMIGDRPMVECSFAHPCDVLHPVTQEPLILTGRYDMLGILEDNPENIFVVDEKTTKALGSTWPKQWTLRSQFMQYTWGSRKDGHKTKGAIVRGVAILKTAITHAEALVYFPEWMIDRWYDNAMQRLELLKWMWQSGRWQYNFDSTCTNYGGCSYKMLCESENPDTWIEPYYTIRKWDPLRVEEPV